jgi:NADPH:quinone reductase-like Zn-dependent oxidoreductase
MMRAIQLDRPGGADALTMRDLPVLTRTDGEVLIRTIASSINPVDWKTRTMAGADRLPMTLGCDLTGVVLVEHESAGRARFSYFDPAGRRMTMHGSAWSWLYSWRQ